MAIQQQHASGGRSYPSIPPQHPALVPLVGMVAKAIKQFGAHETAALCFAISASFSEACTDILLGDRRQIAFTEAAGLTAEDLHEMSCWLRSRALELAPVLQ